MDGSRPRFTLGLGREDPFKTYRRHNCDVRHRTYDAWPSAFGVAPYAGRAGTTAGLTATAPMPVWPGVDASLKTSSTSSGAAGSATAT